MAGSFLRQSTASQSRATPPFLDETDAKTAETGLTINNTDVKLVINGAASANKNSGGGTHRVNGVYSLTFDATDTATVGEMEVSIVISGALPVFMTFWVLEEAVYDAMFAASAPGYVPNQPVDLNTIKTQTVTCGAGVTVLASVGTAATSTAQTGDNYARLGAPAGASIAADIATRSTLTQTQVTGGAYALDSASFAFNAALDFTTTQKAATLARVTLVDTVTTLTNLPAITAGWLTDTGIAADAITAAKVAADVTTEIQNGLATTANISALNNLSQSDVRAAVGLATANLDTQLASLATAANLATVAGYIDTEIDTLLATTLDAAGVRAAVGLAAANLDAQLTGISPPTVGDIADAVWDEALSGHATGGSAGAALSAAGTAGDPWVTSLPGSYVAGQAGYILGTKLGDIETDTQDIQSRIPAALDTGGFIKASVRDWGGFGATITADLDGTPIVSAWYYDTTAVALRRIPDGFADLLITNNAMNANVTHNDGVAITSAGGRQEVNVVRWAGSSIVVTMLSACSTNLNTVFNVDFASNYDTGNVRWNTSATVTRMDNGVITSNVFAAGAISASAIGSNAITSAKIATDAIGSAQLAASAATEIATAVEAAILNEADATALLAAIAAKVETFLINDGDATATLAAIATAVTSALGTGSGLTALATQASVDVIDSNVDAVLADTNELQLNQGNWVTATGFSTLNAADVRTAVGLAAANLDTQLASVATQTSVNTLATKLPAHITKNTALNSFPFKMVNSASRPNGKTALTITATRSIDGGAFAACTNSAVEISDGWYYINLSAADLNGNNIVLKFEGTGADTTEIQIVTQNA